MKSPRFSFKGYSIKTAMYRNKDSIKAILVLLTGFNSFAGFDWKTLGLSVAAGFAGLVGKLVLDACDYYFTEVDN